MAATALVLTQVILRVLDRLGLSLRDLRITAGRENAWFLEGEVLNSHVYSVVGTLPERHAPGLDSLAEQKLFPVVIEYFLLTSLFANMSGNRKLENVSQLNASQLDARILSLLNLDEIPGEVIDRFIRALIEDLAPSLLAFWHIDSHFAEKRLARIVAVLPALSFDDGREPSLRKLFAEYKSIVQDADAFFYPAYQEQLGSVRFTDLFVEPALTLRGHDTQVSISRLIDVHRAVVLGDPGGGKSTLLRQLLMQYTAAVADAEYDTQTIPLIPLTVVLRDYQRFAEGVGGSSSLVRYAAAMLAECYGIRCSVDDLDYLLRTGRAVVMFDGLDELVRPQLRRDTVDKIRRFAAQFPAVSIIITSRRVGYQVAPLPESMFRHFELNSFDTSKVTEYVQGWFATRYEDPRKRDMSIDGFMSESGEVTDLRSNPLLLTLLCALYRSQGSLPRTRPEVYRRCAEMLFVQWDTSRGVETEFDVQGVFDNYLAPAVSDLALWIASNPTRLSGVDDRQLRSRVLRYLRSALFERQADAERVASDLIALFRGRAWVLTEVGLNEHDQRLYKFSHQTFLEYFAAVRVAADCGDEVALLDQLAKALGNPLWENIATIALQIWSGNHSRGASRVCAELERRLVGTGTPLSITSYAMSVLHFLLPRDDVATSLITAALGRVPEADVADVGIAALENVRHELLRPVRLALVKNLQTAAPCDRSRVLTAAITRTGQLYAVPTATGSGFRADSDADEVIATARQTVGRLRDRDLVPWRLALDVEPLDAILRYYGVGALVSSSETGQRGVRSVVDAFTANSDVEWSTNSDPATTLRAVVGALDAAIKDAHGVPEPLVGGPTSPRRAGAALTASAFQALALDDAFVADWLKLVLYVEELTAQDGPIKIFAQRRTKRDEAKSEREAVRHSIEWRRTLLAEIASRSDRFNEPAERAKAEESVEPLLDAVFDVAPTLIAVTGRRRPVEWIRA